MRLKFLSGQQIFLSPVTPTDAKKILDIKLSPFVQPYMSAALPIDEQDVIKEMQQIKEKGSAYFGIFTLEQPENLIGYVVLDVISTIIRAAEIHICISENYVGKGYGKEVIGLVTNYAFKTLNLHCIRGLVRSNNERSLQCFLSQHYQLVGTLPEWSYYDGEYHDCNIVACIPKYLPC